MKNNSVIVRSKTHYKLGFQDPRPEGKLVYTCMGVASLLSKVMLHSTGRIPNIARYSPSKIAPDTAINLVLGLFSFSGNRGCFANNSMVCLYFFSVFSFCGSCVITFCVL